MFECPSARRPFMIFLMDTWALFTYDKAEGGRVERFSILSSRSPRTDLPQGLGLPTPPTSLDPSALPELNSSVDANIGMRRPRRQRPAAGGPPVVLLLEVAHHAARQGSVPVQSVLHRPPSSSFRKLMQLFYRTCFIVSLHKSLREFIA